MDLDALLVAVADRVATQVAPFADRVAVERAPVGTWDLDDGPFAVVAQTGPAIPALTGDGGTIVDEARVAVAVWQAAADVSAVVTGTIAALERWAPSGSGLAGRIIGAYRVPQPETDVRRTEIEVRYAAPR